MIIKITRLLPPSILGFFFLLRQGQAFRGSSPREVAFKRQEVSPYKSDETCSSWPPSNPNFFAEQLEICWRMVAEYDDDASKDTSCVTSNWSLDQSHETKRRRRRRRTRFKEHPRCTARFGEVLRHARDEASSEDEYDRAIRNARAVLSYVGTDSSSASAPSWIRNGMIAELVSALTSRDLRSFRRRQLELCADEMREAKREVQGTTTNTADFIPEDADMNTLGRLYYSAIRVSVPYLKEVGLTIDHNGFTVLLALCRAASAAQATATNNGITSMENVLTDDGRRLDDALSCHFNGIAAPGCRFLFSPRHGREAKASKDYRDGKKTQSARANHLVVAFSSLGNGLVRHEFGGSLAKMNSQRDAHDAFDVLFVADPAQSWYQKDSRGSFAGFEEYEQRLRAVSKKYVKISMVGDSMAGSASLLFSHLATEVISFSPQVDITNDAHVSRDDMTPSIRRRFRDRLVKSVVEAMEKDVRISIHRGVEMSDVWHTSELVDALSSNSEDACELIEAMSASSGEELNEVSQRRTIRVGTQVEIVEHAECTHHQVATFVKQQDSLLKELSSGIFGYVPGIKLTS